MFPSESINQISMSRQAGYEVGWLEAGRLEAGCGSPGFASTVLGGYGEPWLCWYCAGGCGKPWLCWYCAGEAVGALGLSGSVEITFQSKQSFRNKFLKFPECSKCSKHLEISFCSFLAVPNVANT